MYVATYVSVYVLHTYMYIYKSISYIRTCACVDIIKVKN